MRRTSKEITHERVYELGVVLLQLLKFAIGIDPRGGKQRGQGRELANGQFQSQGLHDQSCI